jgi:geranylgeranyl pyrophosphate synthase
LGENGFILYSESIMKKVANLIAIAVLLAAVFTSCGVRKQDRCPEVGQKTTARR